MSRYQLLRIVIGVGLLVVLLNLYVPRLFFNYSVNAVVSARHIAVTAPIPGYVHGEVPLFGSEIQQGDIIAVIENPTVDRLRLEQLAVEEKAQADYIAALELEIKELKKLKEELSIGKQRYYASLAERTNLELRKAEQRQRELLATLFQARNDLYRKEQLLKGGYVSRSTYEASKYAYQRAEQTVEQAESEIKTLLSSVLSLQQGIYVNTDGRTDAPYHVQRYDEVVMRQSDLETKLTQAKTRYGYLQTSRIIEEKHISELSRRVIKAPVSGSVWRVFVNKGTFMDVNMPIVDMIDCSNLYLDVSISERLFERIRPGQKAKVRLTGTKKYFEGVVDSIRGGAIDPKTSRLMVGFNQVNALREMQILVRINEKDLLQDKADFCHVGRTADVIFDGND